MKWLSCLFLAVLISAPGAHAEERSGIVRTPKDPWALPDLELRGRLAETVGFSSCERVSGLTCTVELKKGRVLPSRIFVEEKYSGGEHRGKRWALIYPRLLPGEKGKATFLRIQGDPERLMLRGEWAGDWVDPY